MPRRCRSFVIMIAMLIQMVARRAAEAISHGIVNGEASAAFVVIDPTRMARMEMVAHTRPIRS